ncbi:MAG: phosphatase PAP2 family protein [Deltaproteobacteria bacterium]|nr:phosphatase PAP2 family protein [Deltaproteobacteria bacterium]MBZ0219705.1 phosphatase PAP2 family protein [Deltaproteobacteria bacterium]
MNFIDGPIIALINAYSRQSVFFDNLVGWIAINPLLKGGVLATLVWWLWFRHGGSRELGRERVLAALLACFPAIALARGLAAALPMRLRPLHEPGAGFVIPHGVDQSVLDGWSSFPSDHAVLFFTIATGLLYLSRPAGVFALAYSAVLIGLPRVYLGFHYPTDVLAGAAMGIAIGWIVVPYLAGKRSFMSAYSWLDSRPAVFYPLFFLVTYQIADLFSSSRGLLRGVRKLVMIILA